MKTQVERAVNEQLTRRKRLALADLGVAVHVKEEWPRIYARTSQYMPAPDDVVFHTTQKSVYEDHVIVKQDRVLGHDKPPAVSVVHVNGRWWVFDGHHALAAYLMLGRNPLLAVYNHDRGDYVAPPRLR